jgi:AhpD family alkylhydroperoxidase
MATDEQKLSLEQKELVAVGASVGAGCHPCVDHHLKAGAKAGIDGERLLTAVTSAERVAAEAAVLMGDHVRGKLGPSAAEPALLPRLEEALASLGAALGANDAKNIERQLRTALGLGATRPQLQQAIETAKTVQENAARIHLREAERLLDALAAPVAASENETESGDGCGCGAEDELEAAPVEAEAPDAEVEAGEGCGCAAKDESDADAEAAATATSGPAAGFAGSMPELFGGARAGQMAGMAAAVANCRRMFEGARGPAATPAETNEPPAATEAAGSCKKEV